MSQVAIATGASSGIGRATACLLRRDGWDVVCVDRHAADHAPMVVGDVADPSTAERAVEVALDRHNHVDALVNAAGIIEFDHSATPTAATRGGGFWTRISPARTSCAAGPCRTSVTRVALSSMWPPRRRLRGLP